MTVIVTAIIDNDYRYARTEEERAALVRRIVDEEHPGWASLVYVWDRPLAEESEPEEWPGRQLRVSTEPDLGVGALNWVGRTPSDDELGSWDSLNPTPIAGVVVGFDGSIPSYFPPSAVLPLEDVRRAVTEHLRTGLRPECVQWQSANRY